jgi:hypothetical protein
MRSAPVATPAPPHAIDHEAERHCPEGDHREVESAHRAADPEIVAQQRHRRAQRGDREAEESGEGVRQEGETIPCEGGRCIAGRGRGWDVHLSERLPAAG